MTFIANWGDTRLPTIFWDRCSPEPMSGCWLWTAVGVPRFYLGNDRVGRKRAILEKWVGKISGRGTVHSVCIAACCNPAHMRFTPRGKGGELERKRQHVAKWKKKNEWRLRSLNREHWLRSAYGITQSDFEKLLAEQENRCAICRTTFDGSPRKDGASKKNVEPRVDHDHESGLVRGVLCNGCNTGLGKFSEQPERLRAAAEYLERSALRCRG